MPRLQTFEGDELDAVLAKVRKEAGAEARVLEAKKVRDGGVAGFFARERYVLTVEVPDEPAAPPRKPAASAVATAPPSSILELADLMDEAEAREVDLSTLRATYEAEQLATLPPVPAPASLRRTEPLRPEHVVHEAAVREPDPLPSTESEEFQDVLRRLAADVELPSTTVMVDDQPQQIVEDIDVSTLSFERFDPTSFATSMRDGADVVGGIDEEGDAIDHDASKEHTAAVAVEEVPMSSLSSLEPAPPVARTPLLRLRRRPTQLDRTVGMGLLELGVPAAYVPDLPGSIRSDEVRAALVTALRLPKPPALPLGDDAVVAIVGERRVAAELADRMADDPVLNGAIVQIADARDFDVKRSAVADRRGMRRRRPVRTVVAIPASPGSSPAWTRDILDRIEPDVVWGVVPAARKAEDVASWAISLGGLDALALTDLHETVSPASTLRLGIPVGLLDGQQATSEAWADLLTARLAAA